MLEHNLYDRTEEILYYLSDNIGSCINDALSNVYGQTVIMEELPEEYILNIHQEIHQCLNCGAWKVPGDIDILTDTCRECYDEKNKRSNNNTINNTINNTTIRVLRSR